MSKTVVAICYDFDRTLSVSDMQTFSLVPSLNMSESEFWEQCDELSKNEGADGVLSYLQAIIKICKQKNIKLTREFLNKQGKNIEFFNGVSTWFKRMNKYARENDIQLEHYIISSGNKEILEGCPIRKYFKQVYACEYLYDKNGEAYWPKTTINFTQKTQYLYRICKGGKALTEEEQVNKKVSKKHVEFRNMIYIGDGASDVPCMLLVKENGGTSISVYSEKSKEIGTQLLKEDRVNYVCKSDYSSGSHLDKLMKTIISSISLREKLIKHSNNQSKKVKNEK